MHVALIKCAGHFFFVVFFKDMEFEEYVLGIRSGLMGGNEGLGTFITIFIKISISIDHY